MARLTPDPSFYPSPAVAAEAPPETHAYVVTLNTGTNGDRAPDALTVLDLEAGSATYGQVVGRLDMPNVGDELHHFGWNACSVRALPVGAAPARRAPLPARPRPALVAHPRRRHQGRPAPAEARQDHRAGGDRRARPATSRAAHHPLRPRRHLRQRARHPRRRRARAASSCSTTTTFDGQGRVGGRPRPAVAGLRLLVAPRLRHDDHQRVGHAEHGRGRRQPELLLGNQYGHKLHVWDLRKPHARAGARPRRGAPDGAGAAPGARPEQGLRLRRRRHLAPQDLSASVWLWVARRRRHVSSVREGDRDPGASRPSPISCRRCCSRSAPCRRWSPTSTCRSTTSSSTSPAGARASSSSTTSRDPFNPRETGSVHLGGIVERAAHPAAGPLNGGPQMVEISRDGQRVYLTNSLYAAWDAQFYPDGIDGWLVKLDAGEDGSLTVDPDFFVELQRRAAAPGPPGRRRRLVRLVLLPGRADARTLWPWLTARAARRLSRPQPGDGLAVRGRAGPAGALARRGAARAAADRARARGSIVADRGARARRWAWSPTRRPCTLGAGGRADRVRPVPLLQAARALPLDQDAASTGAS